MAESSWPDPADGRVVTERQYELLSARYSDDGVYWQPSDPGPVYGDGSGGLVVHVRPDVYGSVRGFGWTSGSEATTLAITPNATGALRVDRVVLRLSRSDWTVRLVVKTGVTSPSDLTRDMGGSGVFETHVAWVAVDPGASSIAANKVTAWPTAVGSRVRAQYSADRNPKPRLGEIAFDYDLGQWSGWTGSAWKSIGADDTGDVAVTLGPKWRPDGSNLVRKVGLVVNVDLNLLFGELVNEVIFKANVSNLLVGTIPATFRPPRNKYCVAGLSGGGQVRLQAQPDGKITAWHSSEDLNYRQSMRASWSWLV